VGSASPAAALVEEDDTPAIEIERASVARATARTGTAVDDEGGLARGVATGLPVHVVAVAHVEQPVVVRFEWFVHHRRLVTHDKLLSDAPRP
jgi:hypothetical protein